MPNSQFSHHETSILTCRMVPHLEGMVLSPGNQPSAGHSAGRMSPCGHDLWDAHLVGQLPTHQVCLDGHESWVTGAEPANGKEVGVNLHHDYIHGAQVSWVPGHLRVSEPMIHLMGTRSPPSIRTHDTSHGYPVTSEYQNP